MTLPGNGTTKKVIATVVAALCIFLISQVLATSNRVTAAENQIKAICDTQAELRKTMETNRVENRDEHQVIRAKLDDIAKEIRK